MVKRSSGISMDCGVVEVVVSRSKVALSGSACDATREMQGSGLAKTLVRYPAGYLSTTILRFSLV